VNRRRFLQTVSASLLTAPLAAEAQPAKRRIAYLSPTVSSVAETTWLRAFSAELSRLGYSDDRVILEQRYADDDLSRLPALANDLISRHFDVIMTFASPASLAAKAATSTIPIVLVAVGDPVGVGLVQSLSRPGGNITGLALNNVESAEKRVELLKEAAPKISRLAVVANKRNPAFNALQIAATRRVAEARGMTIRVFEVMTSEQLPEIFVAMGKDHVNGVVFLPDPAWLAHRERVAQLVLQHQLPSAGHGAEFAVAGTLLSFGADVTDIYRRAARFVDRILKGTSPGDIPVEQPTKYELIINLKTAKALGITIPPSVLLRADRVID
jgi:putative ABC transport system substrate-binding protein